MAMTKSSGAGRAKVTVAPKKKPFPKGSQSPIVVGKPASKAPIGQSPLAKSGFSVMQKAKAQSAKKAGIVLGKKKPMQ